MEIGISLSMLRAWRKVVYGGVARSRTTQPNGVTVQRQNGDIITLVTNDLTRSAVEIAALYKGRWQIELLFRWIKQHLKIRKFLGNNDNAIRLQLFAAMIAYALLRIAARPAVSPCQSSGSPISSQDASSNAAASLPSTNRRPSTQVNPGSPHPLTRSASHTHDFPRTALRILGQSKGVVDANELLTVRKHRLDHQHVQKRDDARLNLLGLQYRAAEGHQL
jgi:hypothetical protein